MPLTSLQADSPPPPPRTLSWGLRVYGCTSPAPARHHVYLHRNRQLLVPATCRQQQCCVGVYYSFIHTGVPNTRVLHQQCTAAAGALVVENKTAPGWTLTLPVLLSSSSLPVLHQPLLTAAKHCFGSFPQPCGFCFALTCLCPLPLLPQRMCVAKSTPGRVLAATAPNLTSWLGCQRAATGSSPTRMFPRMT